MKIVIFQSMKKTGGLFLCNILLMSVALAQVEKIENTVHREEVEAHIRFLAADELKGRDTGSPELEIAARYIAEEFRSSGLRAVKGAEDFFQPVRLVSEKPPAMAVFSYQEKKFSLGDDLLVLAGDSVEVQAPVVFADYALPEELEGMDIEGKIVVARAGSPHEKSPQSSFFIGRDKQAMVAEKGGVALIELYRSNQIPWAMLVRYLNTERLSLDKNSYDKQKVPLIWLNDSQAKHLTFFQNKESATGTITITPQERKKIPAKNVVAMVEGTDPKLKDQYVILSAHYDHVGVGKSNGVQDSIYNGARDNAIGTAALLSAAKYFGENPPRRSVLFLALTAEEKGLLGSAWYADHPLLPLDQMVFNLNTDGAGYNDTTKVTVIGLERTSAEEELRTASEKFGLTAIMDPVPEQNLYDRSDNVSFAAKGVPAVDFAPGFTAFDEEVMRNYHQVSDEAGTLNFNYLERFTEAYIMAARKIADMPRRPFWRKGDKYENTGKDLYGK